MVGDMNLLLSSARAERGAGEGELAFGLTKHGGKIAGGELWGRLGVCLLFSRVEKALGLADGTFSFCPTFSLQRERALEL